ncbi:MAG: hypothetical protein AB8I08_17875 [Sandaracinaceae bacterium]
MRGWVALVTLTLFACGPSDVGRTTGGPLLEPRESEPIDAPPRPAGRPYAAQPIAPFAEAMTDYALTAVRGGPLPEPVIPLSGEVGPVSYREGVEPPDGAMQVLGFAFEMELVLKRGQPVPDAEGAARWGSVHAIIGVTRHGLRLVEFRPRRVRPRGSEGQPPTAMSGALPIAADLLNDVRRGDLDGWALGEPDRQLLGNDAIWSRVRADGPRAVHVRELRALLETVEGPLLGTVFGDMAVLVALPDQRLLSLALRLESTGSGYRLRASPLVEVGQVWPILASTELR